MGHDKEQDRTVEIMAIKPTKIIIVGDTDGKLMEAAKRIINSVKNTGEMK